MPKLEGGRVRASPPSPHHRGVQLYEQRRQLDDGTVGESVLSVAGGAGWRQSRVPHGRSDALWAVARGESIPVTFVVDP